MNLFNRPLKYINVDDIHYNINPILSKEKQWNFIISGRIPGKTSSVLRMLYRQWYNKDRTFIYIKRLIADYSSSTITEIQSEINKFLREEDKIQLVYGKGDMQTGIFNVYCYPLADKVPFKYEDERHLFFKGVALNVSIDRVRANAVTPRLEWMFFDEFIVSRKLGNKYLPYEFDLLSNLYNTVYRKSNNLRVIMAGNPYSKWNIYFSALNVPLGCIKVGEIITGNNWAVEAVKISEELKQWVIEHNSLLELENEEQQMFILEGGNVEDSNLQIEPIQPRCSNLIFVFKVNNKYIGVFRMENIDEEVDCKYWCSVLDNYETSKRKVACFNSYDLGRNSHIVEHSERTRFSRLIKAYRFWQVCYRDLETVSYMDEVWDNLL